MADSTDPVLMRSRISWVVALLGAFVATWVACLIFFGSLIDWWEGLVTPVHTLPGVPPTPMPAAAGAAPGLVTLAHTLPGVIAMAVSLLAPAYLVTLFLRRQRFAVLSGIQRWSIAVGIPILFVAVVVGLMLIGYYVGPIVIPYNAAN
jgi:hypothetical protein